MLAFHFQLSKAQRISIQKVLEEVFRTMEHLTSSGSGIVSLISQVQYLVQSLSVNKSNALLKMGGRRNTIHYAALPGRGICSSKRFHTAAHIPNNSQGLTGQINKCVSFSSQEASERTISSPTT